MCLQLSICFDLFYRKEKHWPPARLTLWSSGAMCKNGVHQIYLTLDECAHVEGHSPLWMSGLPCGCFDWMLSINTSEQRLQLQPADNPQSPVLNCYSFHWFCSWADTCFMTNSYLMRRILQHPPVCKLHITQSRSHSWILSRSLPCPAAQPTASKDREFQRLHRTR